MANALQTEPTRTRRDPLNRDRVLVAAVELADREGLDSLSMRRLGQELGVEAMSLYNHVANKEDLLDGMLDVVVAEIDPPIAGSDWKPTIRARILSARQALASASLGIGRHRLAEQPDPGSARLHGLDGGHHSQRAIARPDPPCVPRARQPRSRFHAGALRRLRTARRQLSGARADGAPDGAALPAHRRDRGRGQPRRRVMSSGAAATISSSSSSASTSSSTVSSASARPAALDALVDHPLDRLSGILAGIDRVLEHQVHLAPLDDLERIMDSRGTSVPIAARERLSASCSSSWMRSRCSPRPFIFSSLTSAAASSTPCSARIAAKRRHSLGGCLDVVDREAFARGLHEVDHVVQSNGQLVDVLAVERRDERRLEPRIDLAIDLVAPLLERLDLADALVEPVVVLDKLVQLRTGLGQVVARRHKQVEELDVPRESVERPLDPHAHPTPAIRLCQRGSSRTKRGRQRLPRLES